METNMSKGVGEHYLCIPECTLLAAHVDRSLEIAAAVAWFCMVVDPLGWIRGRHTTPLRWATRLGYSQLMCKDHGPWCSSKGLEEGNPSCLDVCDNKIGWSQASHCCLWWSCGACLLLLFLFLCIFSSFLALFSSFFSFPSLFYHNTLFSARQS